VVRFTNNGAVTAELSKGPAVRRVGWADSRLVRGHVERQAVGADRLSLVHAPIDASWLNQVEIYFSIIQRKVLTPNDFAKSESIRMRLPSYEQLSNCTPKPFAWKSTRLDMLIWLKRASPNSLASSAA
jgi:hypothetical protein